jgi:UDPglucose 6-dehydrogenase
LPKDLRALRDIAVSVAVEPALLDATLEINRRQVERICARIGVLIDGLPGRRIGILGLAFKAGTDDVRESSAIALIEQLLAGSAEVAVHDPVAMDNARRTLGTRVAYAPLEDYLAVAESADALVLATGWEAYRDPDLARLRAAMRRPLLIDARNFYDAQRIARTGIQYEGIGRTA